MPKGPRYGFLLESIFGGPGLSASLLPQWGRNLQRMMERFNYQAAAYVQVKDDHSGRVRLDSQGHPIVEYSLGPKDAPKVHKGYELLAGIFLKAGAKAVFLPHIDVKPLRKMDEVSSIASLDLSPNKLSLVSAHQMGSCRMGEDPRESVVNSRGQVHGLKNLYIADASVFPTAIGVNPQITIAAISTLFAQDMVRS
jgi:hypothetical protein